jgi:membrane protease YdiL (CAAX protease family)
VIRQRVVLPLVFAAVVTAFALYRPAPCTALYAGTALYLLFTPAGLLAKWRLDKRFPLAFPVYFLTLLAAGAVVLAVPQIGQDYIETSKAQAKFFEVTSRCPLGAFLTAFQALVLAPLVEEVLFRGILFEEVRRRWGLAAAYATSSFMFALLHRPGLGAVPVFIVALSLAYAYHKYGLPASIILHFFQNAAALYVNYFSRSL